jgi:uncharacterized membrane protein YhiD involved in acid resistance
MSDLLNNYSYLQFLLLNFLAAFLGYSLRFSLAAVKQKWVTSYHQTLTYCLLPCITLIITTLISSNIALSLGMIGALSIVRFRNPVKSPLELVMFFALITIGIGTAVNFKLSVMLTFVIIFLIATFHLLEKYFKNKNKTFFSNSYDEGTICHSLEVKSKVKVPSLESSKNLNSYYFNKVENSYNYRLVFSYKDDLDQLKTDLEKNVDIEFIDIKYAL